MTASGVLTQLVVMMILPIYKKAVLPTCGAHCVVICYSTPYFESPKSHTNMNKMSPPEVITSDLLKLRKHTFILNG